MSKDNVKKMFVKIEQDAQMKKKYMEMTQLHQKETDKKLAGKLIDLGKATGLSFSIEDLVAARAELIDKANSNRELSEGDLNNVAGGGSQKTGSIIISILGVGIVCAAISIDSEVFMAGECGKFMSTAC